MDNRFQTRSRPDPALANRFSSAAVSSALGRSLVRDSQGFHTASSLSGWVRPMSASQRTLVILIENGGVDLGIPGLVGKLFSAVPGGGSIPDGYKKKLVDYLHEKIAGFTDNLIESAELTLNRYTDAKPNFFSSVVVLRNGTASYDELKQQLFSLSRDGRIIDLLILTHGGEDSISVTGGVSGQRIRDMRAEFGKPLAIRSVYMMNCVGASLNQAWLDAGAKASSGAIRNNYLPEPTTYFFWQAWKAGQAFDAAVTSAYQKTVDLMDDTVRGFFAALPMPLDQLGALVNFAGMDFVKDSAPVIQGDASVTIASDDLVFSQSLARGKALAMTVLPVSVLRTIAAAQSDPVASAPRACVVSPQGLAFIKGRTPFHATAYDDLGHCAIGYGTALHRGPCDARSEERRYAGGISEDEAMQLLVARVRHCEDMLNDAVRVNLNQNQTDALASFVFSLGHKRFRESTLLQLLNEGNYAAVPVELRKWTKARRDIALVDVPELVASRNAEAELFMKAPAVTPPAQPAAQSLSLVAPPRRARTVITQSLATPFGFAATEWEPLISFRPPTAIQTAVNGKGLNWHVHRIEDAYGDINLDYYPVSISAMPVVGGRTLSAEELLSYTRLNINSFVDTRISEFSPYDGAEAAVWNSGSPLGSVVHIDMKAFGGWVNPDDGSVVVAEHAADHWIFSTIWTVMDMAHPVSGNRQFGYTAAEGAGFVFYTRGADRTTGVLDLAAMSVVYSSAHNLWLSFQSGVAAFVNGNGGSATVGSATSIRTPWPDIRASSHHPSLAWAQSFTRSFGLDPDRKGTFLIPDCFPDDFKGDPPFGVLPGLIVGNMEVVGCVVKASQGVQWGARNEDWFKRAWKTLRELAADRYGVDFFRGCYHFLRFNADGARQADYFCDLVDAAGGWGPGDLMPWVDVEEGGQGNWAPQRLETITDPALRKRLAGEVATCASAFVERFKQRTGLRIAVYGRGLLRDLQMAEGTFGADSAVNPAYTKTMPPMEKYGVALDDISLWQLSGDDGPANPKFPKTLPGWGTHDYSVYIDGARETTLKSLRERCLASRRVETP